MISEAPTKARIAEARKLVRKHKTTGVLYDYAFYTLKKLYSNDMMPAGRVVVGWMYADTKLRFADGWEVTTSKIKSVKNVDGGRIVTTLNSTYFLPDGVSAKETLADRLKRSIERGNTRSKMRGDYSVLNARKRNAA